MVSTGLSDVIGSWKIIEMSLPRSARISASGSVEQIPPLEADCAADDAAGRRLDQPQDRQRGDALAAAGFADDAQRLAGAQRKRDAVDRAHDAVAGEEIGLQIVDLENRVRRPRLPRRVRTCALSSSRRSQAARQPRIERVAQPVADEIDRQHRDREEEARNENDVGGNQKQRAALGDDVAPARRSSAACRRRESSGSPR